MELAEFGRELHGDAYRTAEQGIQRVDPKNLTLEDYAEVAGNGLGYRVEVEFAMEFFLH